MIKLRIAAIVEGDGEEQAVPVLIRRCFENVGLEGHLKILTFRVPASKLVKPNELERVVELAARKLARRGGIFLILDCEDGCPASLGPELLQRMRKTRPDLPSSVVLAYREYEAWFLGAASSLSGHRSLPADLQPHPAPETVRNCKKWLSEKMPRGKSYNEREDQPALTKVFDFQAAASACQSFEKCYRELLGLLRKIATIAP